MYKPAASLLVLAGLSAAAVRMSASAQTLPIDSNPDTRAAMAWAFPLNPPSDPNARKPDMHKPLHVPGSTRTYALADYDDMFGAPDWFPQDHPPMPRIVARGRKPAWACAYCHLPTGQGRPENAPLAVLPAAYIVEQVRAFRSGERVTGRPETAKWMPAEARNVTQADLQSAAKYFSNLRFRLWTRVVETASVPKTHVAHGMLVPDADRNANRSVIASSRLPPTSRAPSCATPASASWRTFRPAASHAARRLLRKA